MYLVMVVVMLDSIISTKPTVALYRPVRFVKPSSTFGYVGILHSFLKVFLYFRNLSKIFQWFCL